jgi:multidrug resistance efflux pump
MLLWRALSPASDHLVGLQNDSESYERTIEALEGLKLNNAMAIAAQADFSNFQMKDVCRPLSEIVQNSLVLSPKLRWDIERIESMLFEIVASFASLEDADSNLEQRQTDMDGSSEASLDQDQQEEKEESEKGDTKIGKLPIEPFDNDVSIVVGIAVVVGANRLHKV